MSVTPGRIICLSAEAADWLWRIGAWDQVAGVTAFFKQPEEAAPKPRVSGFSTAQLNVIERLAPDLVITFSDVQAEVSAALMKRGFPVLATNQRTLEETEATLALLARVVGREAEGRHWLEQFRNQLGPAQTDMRRPRVYFEEWDDPLITGIAWVSELIERAGGEDVFAGLRGKRKAAERVVSAEQVRSADPEIILASWCGKPVEVGAMSARPGWGDISAIRSGRVHEIPGEDILQPGFRLVCGYERIGELFRSGQTGTLKSPSPPTLK